MYFVVKHVYLNILEVPFHLKCECWHFHMKSFEYIHVRVKVRKERTGKNPVDYFEDMTSFLFVGHLCWSHVVSVWCV